MSPARPVLKAGLGLVAALALSGCISVLPKTKPALLYRFGPGETAAAAPAAAPAARRPVLGLATIDFDSAADTDQILTVTGQDVAYIWETGMFMLKTKEALDKGEVMRIERGYDPSLLAG